MTNKVLIISGPTASGKSALALNFAEFQNISIINADSLQIYKGLPILSSQPTKAEKEKVPHHLYAVLNPEENSSVGLWLKLVKSAIEESWQQKKLPVIVGGSGMYISKLVEGISEIPEIDEEIKKLSRELFEKIGAEEFKEKLINLGEKKERIINLDKQRLIRAYEVLKQTEKSLFWWQNQPNKMLFDDKIFTHINLNPNREELYKNCNWRFELMLKNGAIDEVEKLVKKFSVASRDPSASPQDDPSCHIERSEISLAIMNKNLPITKTLGFIEIVDFLNERISYEEAIKIASQKTRNYAKRQLTWFRHQLPNKLVFSEPQAALSYLKNYEI